MFENRKAHMDFFFQRTQGKQQRGEMLSEKLGEWYGRSNYLCLNTIKISLPKTSIRSVTTFVRSGS